MMKRILSVILCIVMLLGIMPVSAAGYTIIKSVNVTVQVPKAGEQ